MKLYLEDKHQGENSNFPNLAEETYKRKQRPYNEKKSEKQ